MASSCEIDVESNVRSGNEEPPLFKADGEYAYAEIQKGDKVGESGEEMWMGFRGLIEAIRLKSWQNRQDMERWKDKRI